MKKLISILVVLCMLVSAMPAFAAGTLFADNVEIPETGIFCFYDFENFNADNSTNLAFTQQTNYNGTMYYANGVVGTADGNNYFTLNTSGVAFKYGIRNKAGSKASEYFDTGVLKMEYDALVPESSDTSRTNAIAFVTHNDSLTVGADHARNYFSSVESQADGAFIHFSTAKNNGGRPTAGGIDCLTKSINYNTWYKISIVVDYDNGMVYQYLDGELVTSYSVNANAMTKYYGFCYGGLEQVGTPAIRNDYIHIDNFLIERVAKADVEANVVNVGANFVDVEFNDVVDSADVTVDTFSLTKLDDASNADATSATKLSNYKYRVTFANNFAAASKYELVVNSDINEAGTPNKVAEGTKLLFNTVASSSSILEYNANGGWSVDAPNGATEAEAFTKYFHVGSDGTNDFVESKAKLVGFAGITSGGDGETGDNYRVLSITATSTTANNEHNSLVIPFTGVQSVNSGVIEAEFEVVIDPQSSGWFEMAFGLRDTKNPETKYAYDKAWADATQFAGLIHSKTTLDGVNAKWLVPGVPEYKGRPATRGNLNTEDTQSSYWNTSYVLATVSEKINTTPDYDKYKFVVDLDNDFFEVWYNKNKVYTSDYMPGRVNDGVYDAFVITTNYWNAARANWAYFDNLKVTHRPSALNLDSAEFEVAGKKVAYNETVDFGADEMTITMKENVGTVNKDLVKLSGSDDYEVSANGKEITLSFPNGLTNETAYTVTLDSSLASTSGATLGSDVVLSFETVTGEITYQTPVTDISGELEAGDVVNVSVNAKRGIECSATIVIAGYKGTELADVAFDVVTDDDGVLNYEYTVTEKFATADVVKVFVLNNLTDIIPYAVNFTSGN